MTQGKDNSIDLGCYVLGLRESVLRDVAENASGSSVASLRADIVSREWPEYGCQGEKCMLTLSFKTVDQRDRKVSVFVKRQEGDQGFRETSHYQFLNQNQLPVPGLYGSILDEQQMEVLFLEDVQPNLEEDLHVSRKDSKTLFHGLRGCALENNHPCSCQVNLIEREK